MNTKNSTVGGLFDHWAGDGGARVKEPRWSVILNVLHWVDQKPCNDNQVRINLSQSQIL